MIDYVEAAEFLSYQHLSKPLPQCGLVHITGHIEDSDWATSNGSGKSALLSLVKWVWFGICDRGGVDSVIRNGAKNTKGVVRCIVNNTVVEVHRYRKHTEWKNEVHLFINGQQVIHDDTQAQIDKALGFDRDTFLRAMVFDRAASLATMKDAEAKAFFEKLLGIDFDSWYREAQELRKEADVSRGNYVSSVQHNQASLQVQQQELSIAEHQSAQWVSEQTRSVTLSTEQLKRWKEEQQFVQRTLDSLPQLDKTLQKALGDATMRIGRCSSSIEHLQRSVQSMETQQDRTICSECGQRIPEGMLSEKREHRIAAIRHTQGRIEAEQRELLNLRERCAQIQESIDAQAGLVQERSDWEIRLNTANNEIVRLENQTYSENPYLATIERLHNDIENTKICIELDQQHVEQWEAYLRTVDIVLQMFSKTGLRSYMLDQVLPFLNSRLMLYLSLLTGNEIIAQFSTTTKTGREKFTLDVSKLKGGTGYGSLSEGQAARLDLALVLAMFDHIRRTIPTRLLIFDELFDKIDGAGIESIVGVLQELAQTNLVIIISHNPLLSMHASSVINVKMKNHVSYLED